MTFKVLLDEEAYKNLKKLDHAVNLYIRSWLRKNLEGCDDSRVHGKEPKGQYAGIWRYRVGDYRIVSKIEDGKLLILIITIGHRREVYDER